MQRFWLTATRLGLFIQPEMTPLIFARYHRHGYKFTQTTNARKIVENVNARLIDLLGGHDVEALFFMGRIGTRPVPLARSTRKALADMLIDPP